MGEGMWWSTRGMMSSAEVVVSEPVGSRRRLGLVRFRNKTPLRGACRTLRYSEGGSRLSY